jgi:hypothetical protein
VIMSFLLLCLLSRDNVFVYICDSEVE